MSDLSRPPTLSYEKSDVVRWRLLFVGRLALGLVLLASVIVLGQLGYRSFVWYQAYSMQRALISVSRPADGVAFVVPAGTTAPTSPSSQSDDDAHSDRVIFSRVLRAGDGSQRLVLLKGRTIPMGDSGGWTVVIDAELQPVAGVRATEIVRLPRPDALRTVLRSDERLMIFNAQSDDNDPSHLTIRYELDGQVGSIDGWLLPGGNLRLDVRDGPLRDR